jgi:sugar fermentation stimulation protein A
MWVFAIEFRNTNFIYQVIGITFARFPPVISNFSVAERAQTAGFFMHFPYPLIEGRLLRRYKRFLADVTLSDGRVVTAHTANTGAMTGCCEPGARVWLSSADNPKRKYPLTWELIEVTPGVICGINTLLSNRLVREAIEAGSIPELAGYSRLRSEVRYGQENSRIDFLLAKEGAASCYVEVKNVTLVEEGVGRFPDAVSRRGSKHLRELMQVVATGSRGVIFFCVQRDDCHQVRPADAVDAEYGRTLREALAVGVEALAWGAHVKPNGVELVRSLSVVCD